MPVRSATSYSGGVVPGFPLGGAARVLDVGPDWVDLVGPSDADLLLVRVPQGSKRVILLSSTDALAGTVATIEQSNRSWILDAGVWELCTDRDRSTGPRFYIAIDPADGSSDAPRAAVRTMEAATL